MLDVVKNQRRVLECRGSVGEDGAWCLCLMVIVEAGRQKLPLLWNGLLVVLRLDWRLTVVEWLRLNLVSMPGLLYDVWVLLGLVLWVLRGQRVWCSLRFNIVGLWAPDLSYQGSRLFSVVAAIH